MTPKTIDQLHPPKTRSRSRVARIAVLVLLVLLLAIAAVPNYIQGKWSWAKPVSVQNLKSLRNLSETGLSLDQWKITEQVQATIGGHKWSAQHIVPENPADPDDSAILLLRPQNSHKIQPEVDWVDVRGINRWKTDSYNSLKFAIDAPDGNIPVQTRFFRAWNENKTYAVAQWYAWPDGGHPKPSRWFVADQRAQLRGDRQPWIAVNLQIPIEPLGDINSVKSEMELLAKQVHSTLIADLFQERP
ncbi:MAG: cyanoexosortase B system-associated protein [Cyanobacteriota bacterium]|nr:cyanoexosortase B system-associated protein [Cyanobacteriota bacterium]